MKLYIWNLLCWIDCGLNTICGGSYMETCSSRLGRYYETVYAARVIADCVDWLAFFLVGEMNHCKSNILESSHYIGREVIK